jgi:gliding motility-associated-like protein
LSGDYSISILDKISTCSTNTIINVPAEPFKLKAQSRPEICLNGKGTITVELPSDKIDLVWNDTNAVNLLLRENLSSGTFSFTASSDLNPGSQCSIDSSITIKNEVHIVDIEDVIIKNASCINPNGEGEIVINSDTVSYVINWQDLGTDLTKEFKRTSLAAGEYFATVYEEGTNCKADTSFIIIPKGFDADVNFSNTICNSNIGGIEVELTEGDKDEFVISWDDISDNIYKRSNLDSGIYTFRIVSKIDPTCNIDSSIFISKSTNKLTASFDIEYGRSLDEVFLNDSVKFINTSPDKTPIVEWRFPDGVTGNGDIYSHAFTTEGRKIIELYIADQYGCNATVKRPLTVLDFFDCGLAMPNAFTPNDDGINDDIGILGFADKIELRIYTRWGEMIYRSFDIKERWDGTFLNGESPVDTYIYQLDYICRPSRGKEIKDFMMGEITLIR